MTNPEKKKELNEKVKKRVVNPPVIDLYGRFAFCIFLFLLMDGKKVNQERRTL